MTSWPALPYEQWRETRDTLHMYTQVIGKLRLALCPFEPEWGHVPLYVTARGLTTTPMPAGERALEAEFDLIAHELKMSTSSGEVDRRPLGGDVADFHRDVQSMLRALQIEVSTSPMPSEVESPIPFPEDHTHGTYDAEHVARFFKALSMADLVMREHRARFRGRTTPVQFFWGTFDLALTRYSGRSIVPRPGAGIIERVSGDAEAICAGWWPGDERNRQPAFYAYAYPPPEGLERIPLQPAMAAWSPEAREFLLPYDAVRSAPEPRAAILDFLDSTYVGGAKLLGWDEHLTEVSAVPGDHLPGLGDDLS